MFNILKENQTVVVKWGTKNKEWFVNKGYDFTKYTDELLVKAEDLMRTSKVLVTVVCDHCHENEMEIKYYAVTKSQSKLNYCDECYSIKSNIVVNCKTCNNEFESTLMALKKSKSGHLFCSNKCVAGFNATEKYNRIETQCTVCKEYYLVIPANLDKAVACSIECHNEWQKGYWAIEENHLHRTKKIHASIRKYRNNTEKETKPEYMVREWLESQGFIKGIDFFQEERMLNRFFADFFFPKGNLVIEVQGDYWHANPEVYGEGLKSLNDMQIKNIKRDAIKKDLLINDGNKYIEVWEKDIYSNVDELMRNKLLNI